MGLVLSAALAAGIGASGAEGAPIGAVTEPAQVTGVLRSIDTWILPQPKEVTPDAGMFDLTKCKGVQVVGDTSGAGDIANDCVDIVRQKSGMTLAKASANGGGLVTIGLFPDGKPTQGFGAMSAETFAGVGAQGYAIEIGTGGVFVAARDLDGLFYGVSTLGQIACDRTSLPAMTIRDWPSMQYRGGMYDINRGQVPTMDTLKRLVGVFSDAKMNVMELYIEDVFKWKSHPDIAQPEAMSAEEYRAIFDYAAARRMDVHPMMQVLGHEDRILNMPQYNKYMVPWPEGGVGDHPWTATLDIRKPEAVHFMNELLDEICEAFPGKFLNVDITEIADYGFVKSGTKAEDLPELVYQYVLKLRDMLAKHGMRLMIAQCPLDAAGHLNGMGPVLNRMPKDIVITSYYTAEFYGGWEKDFPRMRDAGIDFFAQPWIDSHGRILPYMEHSKDFSDITVSRGLQYGAKGSVTCDWGDMGHYGMAGTTWYPFMYHGASAWTGARIDRDYFDTAFSRQMYGTLDSVAAKGLCAAGDINGQTMRTRKPDGGEEERGYAGNTTLGQHYWEFFNDPFTDPEVTKIIDPYAVGSKSLQSATRALNLLRFARRQAKRNVDNLDQLEFGARCYEAMARKLIMRAHYLDDSYPREKLAAEISGLVETYEGLKADFRRLWLAEDKDNGGFKALVDRFDRTIVPCKQKLDELSK